METLDEKMSANLPWRVELDGSRSLAVVHEHRWLGAIGWPLFALGLGCAAGLWFVPFGGDYPAWPFQAVGTLMGAGFALMGLHLSLNRVEIAADRVAGVVTRREGFGPFVRTRKYRLAGLEAVRCEPGSIRGFGFSPNGGDYVMLLQWPDRVVPVASFVELAPVREEATRWASFLGCPLLDRSGQSRADWLLERRSRPSGRKAKASPEETPRRGAAPASRKDGEA